MDALRLAFRASANRMQILLAINPGFLASPAAVAYEFCAGTICESSLCLATMIVWPVNGNDPPSVPTTIPRQRPSARLRLRLRPLREAIRKHWNESATIVADPLPSSSSPAAPPHPCSSESGSSDAAVASAIEPDADIEMIASFGADTLTGMETLAQPH